MNNNKLKFSIRNAKLSDLTELIELEKIWPANERADPEILKSRIQKFPEGYFVAEDSSGIIASIISYPYEYKSTDISNYPSWNEVVKNAYKNFNPESLTNALYII